MAVARRLIAGRALAVAFWLVVFGAIGAYRHRLYLHRLHGYGPHGPPDDPPAGSEEERREHPGTTAGEVLLLGWTHTLDHWNSSSFVLHTPRKAPGKFRIGIFGDSHVEGAEVAKDFDFPTLLQKRFQAAGDKRVEIINFGVGGYSFSQAFLMWKFFAERYQLDRAIFLIGPQYFGRDDTFALMDDNFYSIHARYILRDGKPELLAPLGGSRRQVGLIYHGLAPVWRYLRYDSRMPLLARMLLSPPTPSRFNPFYYAPFGNSKREIASIERLLLERAAARIPTILLLDHSIAPYRDQLLGSGDVDFLEYGAYAHRSTLMLAPMSHWSAVGNRLRAEQMFAYLTGKEKAEFPFIDLVPLKPGVARSTRPLFEISDGTLTLDGKPVGRLMVPMLDAPNFSEPVDLRGRRIAALFNVGGGPDFVPLTALPGRSDEVVLTFRLDGELQQARLGRASSPSGIVASLDPGPRDWRGVSARKGAPWEIGMTNAGFIDGISIRAAGRISDASLLLAGREILKGRVDGEGRIAFKPSEGEFVRIREEAGQEFDPFRVKKTGMLCVGKNVPFIGYRLAPTPLPTIERPLRAPLQVR